MEVVITKENFEKEVINSDIPVLVDFFATWCGPCRMLAPVIEEIAKEYEGRVKVCKINVDDEGELAMRYGIASIPTVLLFKDGQVTDKSLGYVPKSRLESMLG
ncbi:MAG: thioredoxin [Ruminococcaceae bacterium]|nr:thioredoxin [Oscillospiraceae bacterium]